MKKQDITPSYAPVAKKKNLAFRLATNRQISRIHIAYPVVSHIMRDAIKQIYRRMYARFLSIFPVPAYLKAAKMGNGGFGRKYFMGARASIK